MKLIRSKVYFFIITLGILLLGTTAGLAFFWQKKFSLHTQVIFLEKQLSELSQVQVPSLSDIEGQHVFRHSLNNENKDLLLYEPESFSFRLEAWLVDTATKDAKLLSGYPPSYRNDLQNVTVSSTNDPTLLLLQWKNGEIDYFDRSTARFLASMNYDQPSSGKFIDTDGHSYRLSFVSNCKDARPLYLADVLVTGVHVTEIGEFWSIEKEFDIPFDAPIAATCFQNELQENLFGNIVFDPNHNIAWIELPQKKYLVMDLSNMDVGGIHTADESPESQPVVSREQLFNARYRVAGSNKWITLKNGNLDGTKYSGEEYGLYAFGDLDGDGKDDAVLLSSDWFVNDDAYIVAVLSKNNEHLAWHYKESPLYVARYPQFLTIRANKLILTHYYADEDGTPHYIVSSLKKESWRKE